MEYEACFEGEITCNPPISQKEWESVAATWLSSPLAGLDHQERPEGAGGLFRAFVPEVGPDGVATIKANTTAKPREWAWMVERLLQQFRHGGPWGVRRFEGRFTGKDAEGARYLYSIAYNQLCDLRVAEPHDLVRAILKAAAYLTVAVQETDEELSFSLKRLFTPGAEDDQIQRLASYMVDYADEHFVGIRGATDAEAVAAAVPRNLIDFADRVRTVAFIARTLAKVLGVAEAYSDAVDREFSGLVSAEMGTPLTAEIVAAARRAVTTGRRSQRFMPPEGIRITVRAEGKYDLNVTLTGIAPQWGWDEDGERTPALDRLIRAIGYVIFQSVDLLERQVHFTPKPAN